MGSNSILSGSVPAFSKDFGKKKRTNRLAKLKQCKLDARREQWLSQAKNKGCMQEAKVGVGSPPSSLPLTEEPNMSLGNPGMRSRGEGSEGSSRHSSDLESLSNSLTSSFLGDNDSGKDRPGSSSGSSNGSNSSQCSGSFSEGEDDDGCLDDWEVVADALTADDKLQCKNSETLIQPETLIGSDAPPELLNKACGVGFLESECKGTVPRVAANNCAWRPDDASRPQSLPNLSKQYSFPMNAERHCGRGANTWARRSIISQPSSCPICYEDLDLTDSSFLPCSCGFRICLFCHKRILEADERCPGCRKRYDPINRDTGVNGGALPYCFARSFSMHTES